MSIKNKILSFLKLDLSDKLNLVSRYYNILHTRYVYRYLLKKCGYNNLIRKPILWSPNFIEIENNCYIGHGCRLEAIKRWNKQTFSPVLTIGDSTSMEQGCHIIFANKLSIGKDCTISYNVMITDNDHEYQQLNIDIIKQQLLAKETSIGDNCFIGAGAKIQAGTILGKQCIVGANSVVRGVFPDYCVIAGIPAKIIKRYNVKTKKWQKINQIEEYL